MTDQQPVIPHEPWYASPVFVNGAIAIVGQAVSVGFRIAGRFVEMEASVVEATVADVTQLLAAGFGIASLYYRFRSKAAPLTLTAKGAEEKAVMNPSLLPSDPTKVTVPEK